MPVYFKSNIRLMKNGDFLFLEQYKKENFIAETWSEKKGQKYSFFATWTLPTKTQRPFIMTLGDFNLFKGGFIQFDDELTCIRSFSFVCSYILFIRSEFLREGQLMYFRLGVKPFLIGIWLDKNTVCRKLF